METLMANAIPKKNLFHLKLLNVRNPKNFFFHCIHAWCKK
ncbi:hypothetical protein HPCPY1662_0118 [Helicobacter pylori CPY1662]|nr:hypothetical protein HPCPY1662_0118 [Helicobacter pylori CPY1662]